jgi:hypothetical protein
MMDADFDESDIDLLMDIVGRLSLADVAEFGSRWRDCEQFLRRLGYGAKVIVSSERSECLLVNRHFLRFNDSRFNDSTNRSSANAWRRRHTALATSSFLNRDRHAQERCRNRRAIVTLGDGPPSGRVVLAIEQVFHFFL